LKKRGCFASGFLDDVEHGSRSSPIGSSQPAARPVDGPQPRTPSLPNTTTTSRARRLRIRPRMTTPYRPEPPRSESAPRRSVTWCARSRWNEAASILANSSVAPADGREAGARLPPPPDAHGVRQHAELPRHRPRPFTLRTAKDDLRPQHPLLRHRARSHPGRQSRSILFAHHERPCHLRHATATANVTNYSEMEH